MLDPTGLLDDVTYDSENVWFLKTHTDEGGEEDTVNLWGKCPRWWFDENKNSEGIRHVLERTMEFDEVDRWEDDFEDLLVEE